eukprot:m.129292 g.129292  ORF g.129292 m.129292 type:complete len:4796 (-) comp15694_c0_seq1:72-14459(-)
MADVDEPKGDNEQTPTTTGNASPQDDATASVTSSSQNDETADTTAATTNNDTNEPSNTDAAVDNQDKEQQEEAPTPEADNDTAATEPQQPQDAASTEGNDEKTSDSQEADTTSPASDDSPASTSQEDTTASPDTEPKAKESQAEDTNTEPSNDVNQNEDATSSPTANDEEQKQADDAQQDQQEPQEQPSEPEPEPQPEPEPEPEPETEADIIAKQQAAVEVKRREVRALPRPPDGERKTNPRTRMAAAPVQKLSRRAHIVAKPQERSKSKVTNKDSTMDATKTTKEQRAAKASSMDARHKYILSCVADLVQLDAETVEAQVLDGPGFERFDGFFAAGGSKHLVFFYQRFPSRKGELVEQVQLADPALEPLTGTCVYCVRGSSRAISTSNVSQDVTFGKFSLDPQSGTVLGGMEAIVADVLEPFLQVNDDWGKMVKGDSQRDEFFDALERFRASLNEANVAVASRVILQAYTPKEGMPVLDLNKMTAGDVSRLSQDAKAIAQLEELLQQWCVQLEQVIAESEQMRKEADDVGPRAELEHWKQQMAKFNGVLDQMKESRCQNVVTVLHHAKSRLLSEWRRLEVRITESSNEAKDNVKYLYTLDKFCGPLYKNNPLEMMEAVPGLMNAVRMIHSISSYYNTSERMTALCVKITNQMITACKQYIYEKEPRIWEQDPKDLIERLSHCRQLNQHYQKSFKREKEKLLATPERRQFDFSEMSIFGKFDTFCVRTEKIVQMLDLMDKWGRLAASKIDGIEPINVLFRSLVNNFKKKPYDVLNTRRRDFDTDFEQFQNDIKDLLQRLQDFTDDSFAQIPSVMRALSLLAKFEKIKHVGLDLREKYDLVLRAYGKELEEVRKVYQAEKQDPSIGRNLPPLAGRIIWARQLFARIEGPMSVFQKSCQDLLKTAEAKKIIKNYNKLGHVLLEYELLHHRAWWKAVDASQSGLNSSLLVRHPDTGALLVNLDPQLPQVIRETKIMQKLNLEIPESAKLLCIQEDRLAQQKNQLQLMIEEYNRVFARVPERVETLLRSASKRVDHEVEPGLTKLSWMSPNLDPYLKKCYAVLEEFEKLLKEVEDIMVIRIDAVLETIRNTDLVSLPEETAWAPKRFVEETENLCAQRSAELQLSNTLVERAVDELVEVLLNSMLPADRDTDHTKSDVATLLTHFNQAVIDAFVRCVRRNLEAIKKRLSRARKDYDDSSAKFPPCFLAAIALEIPNIIMTPALDDIQKAVNQGVHAVIEVGKAISTWKNRPKQHVSKDHSMIGDDEHSLLSAEDSDNIYRLIADNKEVAKNVSSLSSAVNSTKQEVTDVLDRLSGYNRLWKESKDEKTEQFLATEPEIYDFEVAVKQYEEIEKGIMALPESYRVSALELSTETFKQAMIAETRAWKQAYGRGLNTKALKDMNAIFEFCEDTSKRLSRKIVDLEDVRMAMNALKELREEQIRLDNMLGPIEQSYAILSKYDVVVQRSETERLDTLNYEWEKLLALSKQVQDHLIQIAPSFREGLESSVQKFRVEVTSFVKEYDAVGPMVEGITPSEASDRLAIFQVRFDDVWRRFVTYSGGEELFGLPQSDYPDVHRIKKELGLLQKLYGLYNDVLKTIGGYYDILWANVDIEKINSELLDFGNRCRKLPKALKEWQAFHELRKRIDDFNETCPLLEAMSNPAMLSRHWQRIADVTGHHFDVESETFQLRNIMEADLLKSKEEIEDICIAAVKEQDIEAKLKAVVAEWSAHEISFMPFKNRGELLVNGAEISELMTLMEDSLMVLSSLMSNRYNAPYKADIQKWVRNLSDTSEIVEKWLIVQNLWVYLEAVFVGGDIAKQLPKEAKRFSNIDKSWQKIMTRAHENTNLIQCCTGDETMSNLLPHLHEQLELCQKSLVGYLEKKRLLFPRFFFVSDTVLLEILGQASDSHTIQAHLLNVFDNIKSVTFHEKVYDQILAYSSKEGETVHMQRPVMASGNVEIWLGALLQEQRVSLNNVICDAAVQALDQNFQLIEFENSYPAQVGILGIQLLWTRDAEVALNNARTDKKIMQQMDDKFLRLLSELIDATLQELSKVDRVKFETLVTLHVHQRDIFHDLVTMGVKSPQDFEWTKQARFYFQEEERQLVIHITDVIFKYCLEFIGCVDRLCVTPLTDRCYITLAQALNLSMGGAPAGPAGTGKTETVKDMGRCLGKYVVVFNCSDQMDFRGLGRIYKGLAQSGTWGCFDEFNRIELPVLSVAAQQIAIVLNAKKERRTNFIFMDGDDVSLDPEFGLFLTMNPGYAGRQELPENLKIQFRSVAMMVPDRQIIIRVKLASCGFQNNVVLARKFYTLYALCEQQLSKQVHYDFGLRNILSVLRTLGPEKRKNPDDGETTIVMRVLRDMNLSKLVDEDEPLFMSLISDLFPGIELETAAYPDLQEAIAKHAEDAGLINHPSWNLKLVQLFETQRVRHGFMVLGPSGAGKSTNIHTLMKAMTECGTPHKEFRMNPKAITAPQMFGRLDVATNDWTDGIFNVLWRRTLKSKKGEKTWIVLDGPVDAVWIENLNSVLDDNKMLTLANGDRIPMSPDAKLVFEPHNIDNASPATVSRNGMVFMSSSVLDWRPILHGWFKTRTATESEVLRAAFEASFDEVLTYIRVSLNPKMVLLECNYIKQAIDLLTGLIPRGEEGSAPPQVSADYLRRLYVFALMWSVGAVLELDDRARMQEFLVNLKSGLPLPPTKGEETIFEYMVDENGNWEHWSQRVEPFDYPRDPAEPVPAFRSILVPNIDNVRSEFLLHTIAKQGKAVLFIGEPGTAKTVITKGYCKKYNTEEHVWKSLNFSSTTHPNGFQRTLESYVEKRMGTTYGPPGGKAMTVFIDDINMPIINEWGDQIANEIVRQVMAESGFYSLDKPGDFITLADMQYLAAMPHPGGGRNDIPERLKRRFSVFNCTLPANVSIDLIFQTIGSGWFCTERGFTPDVADMAKQLVYLTRKMWQDTKAKMLPTPAKFHYVFNLRDVSRIWEGMLLVKPAECQSVKSLLNLWKHECTRVLADRFTEKKDVQWFQQRILSVVTSELGDEYGPLIEAEPFFVDFLRDAPEPTGEETDDADLEAPKIYEQVPTVEDLKTKLEEYMHMYNETVRGAKMDLVFFHDCMTHLVRVSRIIRIPQGNAMLVGVGGSGKQSVTRLATSIARYKVFQIQLSRSYNANNLLEDLKQLYHIAGVKGQGLTFIMTDNEIKQEGFLEYINNLLATGEIGGLFARDEIDEICSELLPVMKKEFPRRAPSNENLYDYFINRVRNNLHVVLCFSPVSDKFRTRALKFPSIFGGTNMDWFMAWPRDALVAVADHFLRDFPVVCSSEVKQAMVETMGVVQDDVGHACQEYFQRFRRQTYVTPASYLSFLNSYRKLYNEKKVHFENLRQRMQTGLNKLLEASQSVAQLSQELVVKEKELAVASTETEKVLVEVSQSAAAAEAVKSEVQKVKDKAQEIVDTIDKDKKVAEKKLAAAVPALEAAERALETIKPADIATVKKLGKPPHLIMRIMDAVLILFGRRLDPVVPDAERPCPTPSWKESLKTMNGPLLNELMNFNKDTINDEMVELLEVYLGMEDYNLETAMRVCGNVAGLLSWTEAMVTFFGINKEVLPLKANLAVAEAKLRVAQAELAEAQAQLDEKQRELDVVQARFDAVMKKKQELQADAETCRRKMASASALIGGLGGEKVRWTEQAKEFESQIQRLVGDVLIMCAFMSYSGPFNNEFRTLVLTNWRKELDRRGIPFTKALNLIENLVDNATIGEWGLQGLPNDELSLQNGIIVTKATRYPLLIDPQGQGKAWIKNREAKNEMISTSLEHKYFRTHLEDALSQGRPLLIEDVAEELDPCLDNVLDKNFMKAGSTYKVKVGDKEVDIMEGFMLYITTKLPNPTYTPEVFARTSIIDFTVTMKGLEDQLLSKVILTEKAELETERVALITEVTANKKKMKELEDNLLYRLSNTKGSLVDDESLIEVLQVTKTTAEEVNEKLAVAADTELKINTAREEYRPVATRGSILYFLIVEMSMVNVMYQTSLDQFLGIFNYSLANSESSPVPMKRIKKIIEFMTYVVFKYTCRGLYEKDKFLFTILLALKIDLQRGNVKQNEFMTFIKGGAALDLNSVQPKPKSWILDSTWLNLVQLSELPMFADILNQVARNDKAWKAWFDEDNPEEVPLPDGYESNLDVFRRLLLVRSWCPDRTLAQARKYVASSLGQQYADAVLLDLDLMYKESDTRTPMVGLLSMGADPTGSIQHLAKQKRVECREVSMGQGQEVHARRLIASFQQEGGWALLQNCHLALDFMNEVLETMKTAENVHENFRLWITTEVHPKFPINLLQASIKFTNEPPQGIKANLKRTFTDVTQDQLDISNLPQWRPMLYGVAFLHAIVQERRKFGPLGWNIPYEFNQGDLLASFQFVQNHLDDVDPKKGVAWPTVRYMLSEVHYGGRVTDDRDKRLLITYCSQWFGEHMFKDDFAFFTGYQIPACTKIGEFHDYINQLNTFDGPEVFGLHPNADITYMTNTAQTVLSTIVDIQPKESSGGGGETREDAVKRLCKEFLSKLPDDFLPHEVKARLKKMGATSPMNIFLRQEIDRIQRVISLVRTTLSDLLLAIDGTIIMSESLRDALDNMYDARVPKAWSSISWTSTTLGFWFTELIIRHQQFHSWCFQGRPNAYWLTGFFNPQGFITAMRQEITRAHKGWALDSVVCCNDVTKLMGKEDVKEAPKEGVYIYGLSLDGAGWDRRNSQLTDPPPKVLYTPLPVLHLSAINSTAERDKRQYECPIYRKPRRTDLEYVSMVDLKTAAPPEKWVMRGVALLCDTK